MMMGKPFTTISRATVAVILLRQPKLLPVTPERSMGRLLASMSSLAMTASAQCAFSAFPIDRALLATSLRNAFVARNRSRVLTFWRLGWLSLLLPKPGLEVLLLIVNFRDTHAIVGTADLWPPQHVNEGRAPSFRR